MAQIWVTKHLWDDGLHCEWAGVLPNREQQHRKTN
jgi:hypothetical protein